MSPAGVPQGVFRVQRGSFQWLDSMQCGAGGSVLPRRVVSPPIQGSFVGGYVFLGRCPRLRKARLVEAALREFRRECSVYPVGKECSEFSETVFSGSILCNAVLGLYVARRVVSPPIQGSFLGGYVFLGRCPRLRKARLVEAEEVALRECSVAMPV